MLGDKPGAWVDEHWVEETWHGMEKHILHPSGDGMRALGTCVMITIVGLYLVHLLHNGCSKKKPHQRRRPYSGPHREDERLHQA